MVVLNWIIVIMIEIIGNGLLALMIIYERFVEDPQKRTVNNQLISHLCGWLIINNIIGAPIVMYGIRASDIGKSYSSSFRVGKSHSYPSFGRNKWPTNGRRGWGCHV